MKRDEVRAVDQIAIEEYGIPGVVLMENAGRSVAELIALNLKDENSSGARVGILCGAGNNGGDGYVIARHLDRWGYDVCIVSMVPLSQLAGDARINADITANAGFPITVIDDDWGTEQELGELLGDCSIVVDCLLGTGARGAPRGRVATAVNVANQLSAHRVAVDIPTGLDCDTGIPHHPTFQADETATFVAGKAGFENPLAQLHLGKVTVIGIGLPRNLLHRFGIDHDRV